MSLLRGSLKTVAKPAAPFVLHCQKLVLQYCDTWESNRGMRDFLEHSVVDLAKQHPSVEFIVKKVPYKHPLVKGCYDNGRDKAICVRNLKPHEINEKVMLALDSSGKKLRRLDKLPVESTTPFPRGIWSPFHEPDLKTKR